MMKSKTTKLLKKSQEKNKNQMKKDQNQKQ